MDENDPEVQPPHFSVTDADARQHGFADERELRDTQAWAERVRRGQHQRGGDATLNLRNAFWWAIALIGPLIGVTIAFGLAGLLIALVVIAVVVISYSALQRRNLDGEMIVGGIIGALGGLVAVAGGGAAAMTKVIPSSTLWMSGIVCRSPYHLEKTSHFRCVGDAGSYSANYVAILGLQAVLIALVVSGVLAVGLLTRRLFRQRRARA